MFRPFPINYTEKLVPIDLSKFSQHHIPFFYLTNIKLKVGIMRMNGGF